MVLIEQYKAAGEEVKKQFHKTMKIKVTNLGYVDFNDHTYRLIGMFKLSSFISSESSEGRWSDLLAANSEPGTFKSLIDSAASLYVHNYEELDTKYLGIFKVSPDYSDITREVTSLTPDEQRIIKNRY